MFCGLSAVGVHTVCVCTLPCAQLALHQPQHSRASSIRGCHVPLALTESQRAARLLPKGAMCKLGYQGEAWS